MLLSWRHGLSHWHGQEVMSHRDDSGAVPETGADAAVQRGRWLLLAGSAVGIAMVAAGVLGASAVVVPGPGQAASAESVPLPADAVARVNDRLIARRDFEQVLALDLAEGAPPDDSTRRRVLDRMIDEELRTQRAIALNLHFTDPRVRMELASAIAEAATAALDPDPSEPELRAYFDRKRDYFAGRGRLHVQHVWIAIVEGNLGEAYTRARTAAELFREGVPASVVAEIAGNLDPRPVPDSLITPQKLGEYIGRPALNAALTLKPGQVTDPVRATGGFHVLRIQDRQGVADPVFEACRLDVEAEFQTERASRALADQAASLRKAAAIVKTPSLQ
jgi:peptidyl-prolyl cis-trans isomerase C